MESMEKKQLDLNWCTHSWKNFTILQQPKWLDLPKYENILKQINKFPPLIFSHEIIALKNRLKKVENGRAFLLQGGDCAETFKEFSETNIKNKLKIN